MHVIINCKLNNRIIIIFSSKLIVLATVSLCLFVLILDVDTFKCTYYNTYIMNGLLQKMLKTNFIIIIILMHMSCIYFTLTLLFYFNKIYKFYNLL